MAVLTRQRQVERFGSRLDASQHKSVSALCGAMAKRSLFSCAKEQKSDDHRLALLTDVDKGEVAGPTQQRQVERFGSQLDANLQRQVEQFSSQSVENQNRQVEGFSPQSGASWHKDASTLCGATTKKSLVRCAKEQKSDDHRLALLTDVDNGGVAGPTRERQVERFGLQLVEDQERRVEQFSSPSV